VVLVIKKLFLLFIILFSSVFSEETNYTDSFKYSHSDQENIHLIPFPEIKIINLTCDHLHL
jgi:hypothetical protein